MSVASLGAHSSYLNSENEAESHDVIDELANEQFEEAEFGGQNGG
ncbi:hypothetical protein [Natrialba sp. INN-245]|nr:hypothetical protein [Natrialba sp. INN-245]